MHWSAHHIVHYCVGSQLAKVRRIATSTVACTRRGRQRFRIRICAAAVVVVVPARRVVLVAGGRRTFVLLLLLLLLGKAVTAVVATAVVHGGHRAHVGAVVVHVRAEQAEIAKRN